MLTAYRQGEEDFEDVLSFCFPDMAEYYRTVIADNETDFDTFINYLRGKLENHHVIISSENLWTFSYGFLQRFAQEFLGKKEGEPLFEDNDWTTERTVQPLTMNEEMLLRLLFEVCYNLPFCRFF